METKNESAAKVEGPDSVRAKMRAMTVKPCTYDPESRELMLIPQKGARTFCVLTIQKGRLPDKPKPEAFDAGDVKAAIAAFHQHLGRRVHILEQGPETDPDGWPSYQLSYDVTDPPSAELPQ